MAIGDIGGMRIISSELATEDDGYEEKEVMVERGGFWSRIFDTDPTLHIWDDYKPVIVKVPKRKPAMYKIGDILVSHPKLIQELTNSMNGLQIANTCATTNDFSRVYRFENDN